MLQQSNHTKCKTQFLVVIDKVAERKVSLYSNTNAPHIPFIDWRVNDRSDNKSSHVKSSIMGSPQTQHLIGHCGRGTTELSLRNYCSDQKNEYLNPTDKSSSLPWANQHIYKHKIEILMPLPYSDTCRMSIHLEDSEGLVHVCQQLFIIWVTDVVHPAGM
jgi:hypothetical protein